MALNIIDSSNYKAIAIRGLVLAYNIHRSLKHKSLTVNGVITAFLTGFIHSLPTSNLYLILAVTFYLTSSKATKFKEAVKSRKTAILNPNHTASQSQRTHIQVLSNSIFASLYILISIFTTDAEINALLKAGVIGQYVTVIADTLSSELGILSTSNPILITTLKKVPPGTNGGVTKTGLLSGLVGSALISLIASYTYQEKKFQHFIYFTIIGLFGTIIDSVLGAIFQFSLVNKEGLILEPVGGIKIEKEFLWKKKDDLKHVSGTDILSNNQVNLLTGLITSLLSIGLYQVFFSI